MDTIRQSCFSTTCGTHSPLLTTYEEDFEVGCLEEYLYSLLQPEDVFIAGIGINHDDFVSLVQQYFDRNPLQNSQQISKKWDILNYTESEWDPKSINKEFLEDPVDIRMHGIPGLTSTVVSLKAGNGLARREEIEGNYVWHVIEELLGGGDSFSGGGPGKGLLSLLYRKILTRYPLWNCQVEFREYSDIGCFHIHGSADHDNAPYIKMVIAEVVSVLQDLEFESWDLAAAKNRTKAKLFRALENNSALGQLILQDVILYGEILNHSEFMREEINKVSREDIEKYVNIAMSNDFATTTIGNTEIETIEN